MWCCSAREGKKPEVAPSKIEEKPEPAPKGAKWVNALLADPDEFATETKARFRAVDKTGHVISGGDGLIDAKEATELINNLCREVGLKMPNEDKLLEMFKRHDKNESGKLNIDEFSKYFKKVLTEISKREASKK